MDLSKITVLAKTLYHLFAASILFYILYKINFNLFIKCALFIMMLLHFYDTYWFFTHEGNAPI